LRIFGFIVLSIYLVILICAPIFEYADYLQYSPETQKALYPLVVSFEDLLGPLMALPVLVAPIMTLIVFSGFNKRKYSDFYHALPYTRLCLFLSYTGAVLTWIFGILLLCGGVSVLTRCMFTQMYVLSFAGWADILLSLAVMILMVVAAVLLGCSFTGTLLANITASGLILFLPRFVITMLTSTIATKLPFIAEEHFLSILSPQYNILIYYYGNMAIYANSTSLSGNLQCDLYSLFVALVMGILAAVLFVRRKSEAAAQSAPRRSIQAGIRIALTLVLSLGATCILLTDGPQTIVATLYIFAVLIYFIYELISTRKWKNLLRSIPALSVVLLLNLVFAGLVLGTMHFSSAFRPNAGEITSVRFVQDSASMYTNPNALGEEEAGNYADRAVRDITIEDPKIITAVADALQDNLDAFDKGEYDRLESKLYNYTSTPTHLERTVAIQTGSLTRYRRIIFPYEVMESIVEQLSNLPDYRNAYLTLPDALSGTERVHWESVDGKETWNWQEIFDCLGEEIREAGFASWYKFLNMDIPKSNDWRGTSITYTARDPELSTVTIPLSASLTPKTLNLLLQEHYENRTEEETQKVLRLLAGETEIDPSAGYSTIQIEYGYKNAAGELEQKFAYPTDILQSISSTDAVYENMDEKTILDMLKTLGEQLKSADGVPRWDAYVRVYCDCLVKNEAGERETLQGVLYFPLPEAFDLQNWEKLESVGPYEGEVH